MAATTAALTSFGVNMIASNIGGHQLARSLERILEEAHFSGELILTNRKLKDFPKTGTKYNLNDTVFADLSRNRFCELPEEITTFAFLETLLLYHNTIRSIPESVKHLTSLTYLDLRSNQLSSLPREICFLPLQVLLVSNNRLQALPDELGRMDRLTDLDASYNQLTALPARIGELRSLRSLSLRSNQLMYLPRELTCLTLVSLDVSNNRISSLPLEIRQMITLVEFNLENNPLTSPPASLCIRGLVHVFKFLDTQAVKDEKGSRAGGNYDGYTTLRRTPRNNSYGNVLESNRVPRHPVDSGYSTCDGIDKRWSHDMPSVKSKTLESPARRTPTTPPNSLSTDLMDASLTSSSSTIVDESLTLSIGGLTEKSDPNTATLKRNQSPIPATLHQHINYAQSSSSNGSSPDHEDIVIDQHDQQQQQQHQHNGKVDEKYNKNLGNIQTYKEYKEALKQQRNQEISSVYKIKGQKTLYDMSEASNALNSNGTVQSTISSTTASITTTPLTTTIAAATTITTTSHEEFEVRFTNGLSAGATIPKSIMKHSTTNCNYNNVHNGYNNGTNGGTDECLVIPKKPIQKVLPVPSRNAEMNSSLAMKHQNQTTNDGNSPLAYTNGDCSGYVKPNSPMKSINGGAGILCNNNNNNNKLSNGGIKSPGSGPAANKLSAGKSHRTVTWNHDIPPEKLSFTMRREFDRQREETELMTQLRSIIETRLKMTLPEDIASALTDGVILCHLANYVRPRSVASIHVPSPGVSKLTMARCRRNVDNFLEACRKIGVDEELICSCADVVPPNASDDNGVEVNGVCNNNNNNNNHDENTKQPRKLVNPSAVLKTISALIAMDKNPHHQNIKNMQQQREFQAKLHRQQQLEQQLQQNQYPQGENQRQQQQQQYYYQNQSYDDIENEILKRKFQNGVHNHGDDDDDDDYDDGHEQEQQTATCTKEQMMLLSQQENQNHKIIAEQNNSSQNFNAKYELFENKNGFSEFKNYAKYNGYNPDYDNDSVDGVVVCKTKQQQQQESSSNSMANFLRNAKQKTFQKIKLNLMTSHGNNGGNSYATGTTTEQGADPSLHTIVESEQDLAVENEELQHSNESDLFKLVNERATAASEPDSELTLGVNSSVVAQMNHEQQSVYKIYFSNVSTNEKNSFKTKKPSSVSKRIEYFEHSSSHSNAVSKPKVKNNIFSIYRVQNDEKSLPKHVALKKESCSPSQLKHDSLGLTIVLSCVFIVTFLLLVFFPLPG